MGINNFLLVGAGGAIGSMLRYATSLLIVTRIFPLATFTVNIAGSFLIGILLGLSTRNNITDLGWQFLAVGVCGGFTTFSAFSLEGFKLLQQQRYFIFLLYFVISIVAGVLSTYAGYILSK
ncbi:MAG: fluoride efflux transporter CrcB [Ginsengibacter sp.]